jgi:hypothetical protein
MLLPNKSPELNPVVAVSSAVAAHVASRGGSAFFVRQHGAQLLYEFVV